jgi:hypothetical protein
MQSSPEKLTSPYKNPIFERTEENPALEARKIIKEIGWNGDSPINLLDICSAYDYPYTFKDFEEHPNLPGTTHFFDDGSAEILINTRGTDNENGFSEEVTTRRRQRFTMAHELGHCLYKSHSDIALQSDLMSRNNPHARQYDRKKETQANEFASHLLVPDDYLLELLKKTGRIATRDLITIICDHFDVSCMVAIQKLAASAKYPCIGIAFKSNGECLKLTWSKSFPETGLFISRDINIPTDSACDSLRSGRVSDDYLKKRFGTPCAWFQNARRDDLKIVEHSFKLGAYGFITLLEIEESF